MKNTVVREHKKVYQTMTENNIIPTAILLREATYDPITPQETVVAEEYNVNGESNVQFGQIETARAVPPVNLKRFWCEICQISTTTSVGLNSHLMGIKHQQKLTVTNASKEVNIGQNVKSF